MLLALGRTCARAPKRVIGAWLLLLLALGAAVAVLGRVTSEAVTIPGSDSQAAADAARRFPGPVSGPQPLVLHTGPDGARLTDDGARAAVEEAARAISAVPHVSSVSTPYGASAAAHAVSADGRTAYLTVGLDVTGRDITAETADDIVAAAAPARAVGISVTPGGDLAAAVDKPDTGHSELIGLAAASVILLLGFRKAAAAALPLAVGVTGLAVSVAAVGLAGHLTDMPASGTTLAAMIGLGVGIDYTLFCLTRFRELRGRGQGVVEAAAAATATAGRACVFAGGAVIAALGGLALGGLPLLYALALAPGVAVLVAVAAATTLLPALLSLLGRRLGAEPPLTDERDGDRQAGRRGWRRLAAHVAARPWRHLLTGVAVVLVLAAPAAQLAFGLLDGGTKPVGSAARTSYERLADAFGPGVNGALQVTDTLPTPAAGPTDARVAAVGEALAETPGVAAVGTAQLAPDGRTVRWQVTPATAPGDARTAELVDRLRADTLPGATDRGRDGTAHVGGMTATQTDLNDRLAARLPLVIGVVVLVAALLLLTAFRAPVLAAKAALMNLLSVAAAYGVLTAVFQWGWGAELIGLEGATPIPGYVPLVLFAVLFGLSMDYEVFLLTAVREHRMAHGDNRRAVVAGLAGTGRIITSAALIMISVFLAYLLSPDPVVKMFGLGLAAAVALDVTVVRGLLVPSAMVLIGERSWWLPRWLDRLLPHLDPEGGARPEAGGTTGGPASATHDAAAGEAAAPGPGPGPNPESQAQSQSQSDGVGLTVRRGGLS
ncbi:MMPL family transporter [Streptomyces sp. HNM0663]|uniref:MMPL family transporter n=1 Tax=Streptomyces chengmaiensis TaxID=3040919 RepID=A0ABT6HSW5_9ACTN|nr:MMPL family transporter [Streptomyces chengmaiensis]MDH2391450.1 MMPL family transporter [Streptomyces chengmaiensis]